MARVFSEAKLFLVLIFLVRNQNDSQFTSKVVSWSVRILLPEDQKHGHRRSEKAPASSEWASKDVSVENVMSEGESQSNEVKCDVPCSACDQYCVVMYGRDPQADYRVPHRHHAPNPALPWERP